MFWQTNIYVCALHLVFQKVRHHKASSWNLAVHVSHIYRRAESWKSDCLFLAEVKEES